MQRSRKDMWIWFVLPLISPLWTIRMIMTIFNGTEQPISTRRYQLIQQFVAEYPAEQQLANLLHNPRNDQKVVAFLDSVASSNNVTSVHRRNAEVLLVELRLLREES